MQTLLVEAPALHPIQRDIARSRARFRVVVCGRRWGKTRLGVALCLEAACEGKRVWWVGPTYAQSSIAWRLLRPMALCLPGVVVRESDRVLLFPGGGEIWAKSSDQPDNLRGEGVDFLVMDEADYQPEAVWTQVLRPALADRKGRALFISTPRQDGGWFHRLFLLGQSDIGRASGWQSWCHPSATNPFLDPAEVEAARQELGELEFRREFGAEFVATPDAVYPSFARYTHVRPCPFQAGLKLWIGVDFNNRPMSAVMIQRHGDEFRVVGEVVEDGTTAEHAERIAAWCEARGIERDILKRFPSHRAEIIPDASGVSRQHATGQSDHEILKRAGFFLAGPAANPPIKDRDNAVLARLKTAAGEIRLFFDPSAKKTIEAFSRLTRVGRDRSPWSHATDATGYVIHRLAPIVSRGGMKQRETA
jgi:hypothetical protein